MIEDDETLRSRLTTALGVRRWVEEVAAGAPYDEPEDLLAVADVAAAWLTPAEVDEALAHHPRIGERPTGTDAGAAFSRREQAADDAGDADLAAALAAGNRAYEERTGRIFLIRAARRSRREVLAELAPRHGKDEDTELVEIGGQLREIAVGRLRAMLAEDAP